MNLLSKEWGKAKHQRAMIVGWVCECCGIPLTPETMVGHHKIYRRNKGKDTVDNCIIRCLKCEQKDRHAGGKNEKKRSSAKLPRCNDRNRSSSDHDNGRNRSRRCEARIPRCSNLRTAR